MNTMLAPWAIAALAALVLALAATHARAEIVTRAVEYTQGGVTLKGYLAYDDAVEGKRPGIIVFPEWWGVNDYPKRRARELAQLGYIALAADMFGDGKTVATPQEAMALTGPVRSDAALMRDRAAAALRTLREQPQTDGERIAAIGYCFGGTVALELARSGADISAAVAFHAGLKTDKPAEKGAVSARIVVYNGAEDPMVPHAERQAFMKEMTEADADWQLVEFGHAVHTFTNPQADNVGIPGVAYNEKADRRSWEAMKRVFEEELGGSR